MLSGLSNVLEHVRLVEVGDKRSRFFFLVFLTTFASSSSLVDLLINCSECFDHSNLLNIQLINLCVQSTSSILNFVSDGVEHLRERLVDLLDHTLPFRVGVLGVIARRSDDEEVLVGTKSIQHVPEVLITSVFKNHASSINIFGLHSLTSNSLEYLGDNSDQEVQQHDDHKNGIYKPKHPD